MHATSVLQITKYSLINNSCMSVQSETQLRSEEGTMYYQLEEFSYIGNSSMQKELSPSGLRGYFLVCVRGEFTQVADKGPRRNCVRK